MAGSCSQGVRRICCDLPEAGLAITEPLDDRQEQVNFKPAVPKILKTQEKPKLVMGKGIGDNDFREKLKKLSLESVPQKEKLKNISFDL